VKAAIDKIWISYVIKYFFDFPTQTT
jgi:hypothetical protein